MIKIKQHSKTQYSFELSSKSGFTLLKSIPFSSKKEAEKIAKNLKNLVNKSSCVERKTNHKGSFLINFKNTEGMVLCSSLSYASEAGMENGIKNIKNSINQIGIDEPTVRSLK